MCVVSDGKQVDLRGAQRDVLFYRVNGDVEPTIWVCHPVAWKAAKSFTLHFPVPFKDVFPWSGASMCTFEHWISEAQKQSWVAGNTPCQRVMEDGEWSCPRDQSDGRRHPVCSLSISLSMSFVSFSPSFLLPCYSTCAVGCFDVTVWIFKQNNRSPNVMQMNLLWKAD